MIDYLAFVPPAELPPDAATETTLDALKSKFDTPLIFNKDGLATTAGQAAIAQAIVDSEPDVSTLAKDAKLEIVRSLVASLDTKISTLSTDVKTELIRLLLTAIDSKLGGTLTVQQVSTDILRLRALTPRKPAAVTLTTTTVVDLIPIPTNPAHRHVICWICGQNATDTPTIAEFTGGLVPIKVVAPSKGSGRDFTADQQIMTLPAGAAFRVGQNVATTFEASCGYYTIDAAGAPV